MLVKWNGKLIAVSFPLNLALLGLLHIKKHGLFSKSPAERYTKLEFCAL